MLSVHRYTQLYIDETRSKMAAHVAAYRKVEADHTGDLANADKAFREFELHFFNNLVLALDNYFVHRSHHLEHNDGNPLNEVRILCKSIMHHQGIFTEDSSIDYDAAKSVLKYRFGDAIHITEAGFIKLSTAFFADIEAKYLCERPLAI